LRWAPPPSPLFYRYSGTDHRDPAAALARRALSYLTRWHRTG
jgi:hypothetical protein